MGDGDALRVLLGTALGAFGATVVKGIASRKQGDKKRGAGRQFRTYEQEQAAQTNPVRSHSHVRNDTAAPRVVLSATVLRSEQRYVKRLTPAHRSQSGIVEPTAEGVAWMHGKKWTITEVDERDKGTPDEWVPRHPDLVRLTGALGRRLTVVLPPFSPCGAFSSRGLRHRANSTQAAAERQPAIPIGSCDWNAGSRRDSLAQLRA